MYDKCKLYLAGLYGFRTSLAIITHCCLRYITGVYNRMIAERIRRRN